MKTQKNWLTFILKLIKKNFFISDKYAFNLNSKRIADSKSYPANDAETIKFEEYSSRYKGTTRWQTV